MFHNTEQNLKQLAEFLVLARRRRRWRQADVAERIGVSLDTVKRAEKGAPGVGVAVILDLLSLYGQSEAFSALVAPDADAVGIRLADDQLPKRGRRVVYERDF